MKKPFKHTDLSEKRCKLCHRPLKKNLLAKRPDAELCYKCFALKTQ
jgi:hypothetical protein